MNEELDHILPVEDQHDHMLSENCVCGTEPELVTMAGTETEVILHQPIRVSIHTLGEQLPANELQWLEEPGSKAGDQFVFKWAVANEAWEGRAFRSTYPEVFIRLTAHPKKRDGVWRAPFVRAGFRSVQYMAPSGSGSDETSNPRRSIDDAPIEDPFAAVEPLPKRKRPGKRERLRKAA